MRQTMHADERYGKRFSCRQMLVLNKKQNYSQSSEESHDRMLGQKGQDGYKQWCAEACGQRAGSKRRGVTVTQPRQIASK
ncbi:Uncharacterized protein DAT39_003137 [Clarias magur]|uniref:Uncharacterized protein n=1 Tax=Clarias magur TaxID=1594786 RepID=A0A8J4X9Q9_CLAMG|nr:Uncharacterized protein DAT39_003137 [Clarias magur]